MMIPPMPKLTIGLKVTQTISTWLPIRGNDKFAIAKRKISEAFVKVFQKDLQNVVKSSEVSSNLTTLAERRSLISLQRYQIGLKGISGKIRRNLYARSGLFFNVGEFSSNVFWRRMRYGHLLAFSTLMLVKEETFEENNDFENRMQSYARICHDLKRVLTPASYDAKLEPKIEPKTLEDYSIDTVLSCGSNGVVFDAFENNKNLQKNSKLQKKLAQKRKIKLAKKVSKEKKAKKVAVKMIFNFNSSKHFVIKRMMESELITCQNLTCNVEKDWQISKHSRMKSLPPHSNLLTIDHAIIDKVPEDLPLSSSYNAALPVDQGGMARSTTMFLIMKKYSLTLKDLLSKDLDSTTRQLLCLQLLQAAAHLERNNTVHRDLKSDNILIEYDLAGLPRLIVGDFGCSITARTHDDLRIPFTFDIRDGTPCLQPPEVKNAAVGVDKYIDYRKADNWAIGGLITEIMGKGNPLMGNVKPTKSFCTVLDWISQSCLDKDQNYRPSAVLASNILHLNLFGPKIDQMTDKKGDMSEVKNWLLMHAAETMMYRQLPWGQNSVVCDIFTNFLTSIDENDLEHSISVWKSLI